MELILLLVGFTLLNLDSHLNLNRMIAPGLFFIGCALLREGVVNFLLFQTGIISKMTGAEAYSGFAGTLWDYTFILAGIGLVFVSVLLILSVQNTFIAFLSSRPGPALLGASLFCIFIGSARVIGRFEKGSSLTFMLQSLPARLGGIFLLVIALLLLSLGLYELLFPQDFDELIRIISLG